MNTTTPPTPSSCLARLLRSAHLVQHLLFIVALGAACWMWRPVFAFTRYIFNEPTENMFFGWLIPPGVAFILWTRRKQLCQTHSAPAFFQALPMILLGLLLFFVGERGGQARLSQLSIATLTFALPWAFYGWRMAKWVTLPALFLIFILPMGFLDNLTFHLRMITVVLSCGFLNGIGVSVQNVGTAIHSLGSVPFHLDVADPCSGIRSLVAIMAFTAIYGAFTQKRLWKRWALFATSLPLAMIGNLIRLILTGIVSATMGQEAGMKLHDHALFVIAPVTFGLVFLINDFLERIGTTSTVTSTEADTTPPPSVDYTISKVTYVLLALIPIVFLTLPVVMSKTSAVVYEDLDAVGRLQPVAGYQVQYPIFCQNERCLYSCFIPEITPNLPKCPVCEASMDLVSKAEHNILPPDTTLYKASYTKGGRNYFVSAVISGRSRMSIHRPEMCLPAQGMSLTQKKIIELPLTPEHALPIATMTVTARDGTTQGFCYWFFNTETETASHSERIISDILARTLHNRVNRWVMVTLYTNRPLEEPETLRELAIFIQSFYPALRGSVSTK